MAKVSRRIGESVRARMNDECIKEADYIERFYFLRTNDLFCHLKEHNTTQNNACSGLLITEDKLKK